MGNRRDLRRAVGPTFFRRLDPAAAGIVGFLFRLGVMVVTLFGALRVARVSVGTLAAGGAFTAIVLRLAAEQTLASLFAGLVLVVARPFRVGQRVRLQAGALAGVAEGVVSSFGLPYTTLARGDDRISIPNTTVLAAAAVLGRGWVRGFKGLIGRR